MTNTTNTDLTTAVDTLNQFLRDKASITKVSAQMETVNNLISSTNEDIIDERIESLLEMPLVDLFNDLIDNRFVTVKKLAQESETSLYIIADTQKQLSFQKVESVSLDKNKKPLSKGVYEKLVALFMDNLYRCIKSDLSVSGIVTNTPKLNGEYSKLRLEHKFTETSNVALEKQLNIILSYLLPEELKIKAVKADVKYLQYALTRVKNGTLTVMREGTFINELFTMLYFRKNKVAYQFQTQLSAHKKAK